jgi:hypothetical protein
MSVYRCSGLRHLKELKLIDRRKATPDETQAKIKALLPKVEVKFQWKARAH